MGQVKNSYFLFYLNYFIYFILFIYLLFKTLTWVSYFTNLVVQVNLFTLSLFHTHTHTLAPLSSIAPFAFLHFPVVHISIEKSHGTINSCVPQEFLLFIAAHLTFIDVPRHQVKCWHHVELSKTQLYKPISIYMNRWVIFSRNFFRMFSPNKSTKYSNFMVF